MAKERYDIFFSGKLLPGQDEAETRGRVGALFKANAAQLERLFSGEPIRVKRDVDLDTAVKYRVAFRDAGAIVEIKETAAGAESPPSAGAPTGETAAASVAAARQAPSSKPPVASASPPQPAMREESQQDPDDGLSVLPARSGSLIDCARPVEPVPIPDISGLKLISPDASGPPTDESPPPEIDTDSLDLLPAGTGSLEDCAKPVRSVAIPDISALQLASAEESAAQSESDAPLEIGTDDLELMPAATGSLEDCARPVEPVKIPDISHLSVKKDGMPTRDGED
jgi:hypothetical protein